MHTTIITPTEMTSSSQYITLEEFTSSTSPLPTILVPRSHALRLVELCQESEMTPDQNFMDFIGLNNNGDENGAADTTATTASSATNTTNGRVVSNPHVLVTQMALLLYLGEYTHARHLWRRHRKVGRGGAPTAENGSASNDDYAQLEMLWNAAKYCYLWSTGGIHSMTSNSDISSVPSSNNIMMQVESNGSAEESLGGDTNDDSNATLPFSTLALRALHSCTQTDASSQMQPLATYATELIGVFSSRVNKGLHESFDKLDCNEFYLRMNITPDDHQGGEEVWKSFGWTKDEGGYLVSNVDVVLDDIGADEETSGVAEGKDRIGKLTDIVMFLEGKMNA